MWFRLSVSHPPSHVTHWSCDQEIFLKKLYLSFGRTMATNFSNLRLKLSWPESSSHVTHLSCDKVIFTKSFISNFATPMTIKLGRLWVRVKEPDLLFQVNCRSSDRVLFEKRHVSTNVGFQNSDGDIKHRKNYKSKAVFVIQNILTFDSYRCTLRYQYTSYRYLNNKVKIRLRSNLTTTCFTFWD